MIRFDNIEKALKSFKHNQPFDHCVVENFFDLKAAKDLEIISQSTMTRFGLSTTIRWSIKKP